MARSGRNVKGSIRQRQTELTRKAILGAARVLFQRQGYAATTIEQIATEAGVGLSTIYAVFTNKRTILAGVRWKAVQDARVPELFEAALEELDAARRIERIAEQLRNLYETAGDVFAVQRAAAAADSEVAETWAQVRRERGENFFKILEPLRPRLALGLTLDRALEIVQALASYELYEEVVVIAGWTPDEYEGWLGRILTQQLLTDSTATTDLDR